MQKVDFVKAYGLLDWDFMVVYVGKVVCYYPCFFSASERRLEGYGAPVHAATPIA